MWLDTGGKSGKRADFRGAKVERSLPWASDMEQEPIFPAPTSGAPVFAGADLSGANFAHRDILPLPANLRGAKFIYANLSGAKDLTGVDLSGAEFSATTMTGARS